MTYCFLPFISRSPRRTIVGLSGTIVGLGMVGLGLLTVQERTAESGGVNPDHPLGVTPSLTVGLPGYGVDPQSNQAENRLDHYGPQADRVNFARGQLQPTMTLDTLNDRPAMAITNGDTDLQTNLGSTLDPGLSASFVNRQMSISQAMGSPAAVTSRGDTKALLGPTGHQCQTAAGGGKAWCRSEEASVF